MFGHIHTKQKKKHTQTWRRLRLAICVASLVIPMPAPDAQLAADTFQDLFYVPLDHLIHVDVTEGTGCLPDSSRKESYLLDTLFFLLKPILCDKNTGSTPKVP